MRRTCLALFFLLVLITVVTACPAPTDTATEDASADASADAPAAEAGDDADESEEIEVPPENGKPLSEIVAMLEEVGYTPILEIEFENGVWEVEAIHYGRVTEISIDPLTGEPVE